MKGHGRICSPLVSDNGLLPKQRNVSVTIKTAEHKRSHSRLLQQGQKSLSENEKGQNKVNAD